MGTINVKHNQRGMLQKEAIKFRLTLFIMRYYNNICYCPYEVISLKIIIPLYVQNILSRFKSNGFEAFVVGGCVRDSIMGIEPVDWDITTNALPNNTKELFSDLKVIQTGIKHGTLTVVNNKRSVEITTFRIDGKYSDNRRPDSVLFTNELVDDLSRRDFTINAMAYNHDKGLIDEFGSLNDLRAKIIRTVQNPDMRFSEDGLRIIRALRFASTLGFEIEKGTSSSIHKNKTLLKNIAAERLFSELLKLLPGKNVCSVLLDYGDVLGVFIPPVLPAIGFKQLGKKHCYDVWEHTCHTVDAIEPQKELRLTMLLHDLGKVETAQIDENGNSTFHNHAQVSADIAGEILRDLKSDKKTANIVKRLISLHDFEIPQTEAQVKRMLKNVTPDEFKLLLKIKTADKSALSPAFRDVSRQIHTAKKHLERIVSENICYNQEGLSIKGADLIEKGWEGALVGKKLDELTDAVIEDKCPNTRERLLEYLEKNL